MSGLAGSAGVIAMSACLAGRRCRYDGTRCREGGLDFCFDAGRVLAVCPEELGGLPTPRPRSFLVGGDGCGVLDGRARVLNSLGEDVTARFLEGAVRVLQAARSAGVETAYLKESSPSCGVKYVWIGDRRVPGMGVTSALLAREGIKLVSV